MTAESFYVREDDYYGGDLYVEFNGEQDNAVTVTYPIAVVWEAWGSYGRICLTLTSDEARGLSAALLAAIDAATPSEARIA